MALISTATLIAGLTYVGMSAATAATVASGVAMVATASMYVGMAGLVLKVVGAATGNKTISKIGTYMGYAGLAGGIVTGAIGTSEFVDKGIFEYAIANPDKGIDAALYQHGPSHWYAPGFGSSAPTGTEANLTPQETLHKVAAEGVDPKLGTTGTKNVIWDNPPSDHSKATEWVDNTGSSSESMDTQEVKKVLTTDVAIPSAPGTPEAKLAADAAAKAKVISDAAAAAKVVADAAQAATLRTMGMMGAGQLVAGAAQGYYTGQAAEEKLTFEKEVNVQRQTELERRIKNASYAPRVYASSTGLLQQAQQGGA